MTLPWRLIAPVAATLAVEFVATPPRMPGVYALFIGVFAGSLAIHIGQRWQTHHEYRQWLRARLKRLEQAITYHEQALELRRTKNLETP